MTVMSQKEEMVSREARRVLNFLASAGPYANTSVETDVLNQLMLDTSGTIMARGILYDIISRKLSPKVWKLTIKRSNP